jgi:hypothetical protein
LWDEKIKNYRCLDEDRLEDELRKDERLGAGVFRNELRLEVAKLLVVGAVLL